MANLLYKYRSLEPWEFLLDILLNKRLFAAPFENLNDPMEGMFTYSKNEVSPGFIRQLVEEKSRIRICSLSRTYRSTLMWSYYSSGHTGIVLGIEAVRHNDNEYEVCPVTYSQKISFKGYYGSDARTDARGILSKKLSGWKHEKEVRVLTPQEFVPIRVHKVILGYRMTEPRREFVEALVCRIDPEIRVEKMKRENLDSHAAL